MHHQTSRLTIYALFAVAALVILADFSLPGTLRNDEIVKVQREKQRYYNAAGNYHYSYKVVTTTDKFLVSETFAKAALIGQDITYTVSPLFSEVNWYRSRAAEGNSYFSLRIVSGLVLPLFLLLALTVAYSRKWKIGSILFILQVLLLADLMYLIS
ncbi:MAG: hypothetical protein CMC08_10250 [Flavobacteriaceae bacterium]|nr:hypothetical protein [Flavobacteriaceae bacterium]